MSEAKLRRREELFERMGFLVKAIDGLDAIGRHEDADKYEAECARVVEEYEQLGDQIGVVFTPRLGRFSRV